MPADMASILLQSGDGQDYAKLIQLQRQQALAQSLMQQDQGNPGSAPYGGLRNAGNAILGAFLAKRGDQGMADFYNPTSSQPTTPPQPSGQVSNSGPSMPQASPQMPPLSAQSGPTPQIDNTPGPQPMAQSSPQGQPSQPQQGGNGQTPPDLPTLPPMMQRIWAGIPHIPGVPAAAAVRAYMNANPEYYKAYFDSMAPTPDQKNANAAFGPGTPGAQQALQGIVKKAGSTEVRPEGYVIGPDGKITYGPNEASNVYYTTGPNNEPIAHSIPGGAEAAAQAAGARTGAEEQNKIVEVTLPDGRKVPMRVGDVVPFGGQGGQQSSSSVPNIDRNNPLNMSPGGRVSTYQNPTAGLGAAWDNLSAYGKRGINTVAGVMNTWAPVTDNNGRTINPNTPQNIAMISQKLGVRPDQPLNMSDPNVKGQLIDLMRPTETGNRYVGNSAPPQIGETTAQRGVNEATGTAAVGNAHAQAVTDSTLKAIDGLIQLNDQTPDSTGISPDWKSDINKRAPALFKGDAGALAQWNQLNGIGVLGGLKQLQGLGRLDLPEVNQVVKTNGVPADVPRAERLKILQNLKTMVQNNLAASQNNVANLNAPGITTSTAKVPMGNFGQPHPQDIVDELRRRGVVK